MDADAYFHLQSIEEMDNVILYEERQLAGTVFALSLLGAEEAHQLRIERRQPSRLYLCCPQLLPNPRFNTSWQVLVGNRNDCLFITTMGFDIATFNYIIDFGFGLQQIFALIPTTVSHYITFGLAILLEVLRKMPDAAIKWPQWWDDFQALNNLIVERHPLLTGTFAGVDGLNLPVETLEDKNAMYKGWLCEHFVTVLVFSPKGTVIAANLNAPGSWHDSHVAHPIYKKLLNRTPDGFYLIRGTRDKIEEWLAFDRQLLLYRQTAEWGNRGLQGAFG
ncbi:hypothetical protein C8R43DRAFT_1087314 [Mycena crocata]|nr:hypothetical protein C8R43DRAFT_1087314 [Mycena crocata]